MNLHANAALSLKGRRELCLAVVEREPAEPAAAGRVVAQHPAVERARELAAELPAASAPAGYSDQRAVWHRVAQASHRVE